jgi:TonB family protein
MKKFILSIFTFFYLFLLFLYSQDTTFIDLDQRMRKTNNPKFAVYYAKFYKINENKWGAHIYEYGSRIIYMIGEFSNKRLSVREGKLTTFYENGKILSQGNYVDDKKDGDWIWYDKYGRLYCKGHLKQDLADGYWVIYFENGKIDNEHHFLNGKLNGSYKTYFENGNIDEEGTYLNDEFVDTRKLYFDSGTLCAIETYKEGKVADCKYFNKEDKEIKKEEAVFRKQFPGGSKALKKYLSRNVHYTSSAKFWRIQGKVTIKFKVDEDGNTWKATVHKSVYESLDNEVLKAVKAMPRFVMSDELKRTEDDYHYVSYNFTLLF